MNRTIYKVAKIIDEMQIIINAGQEAGIKKDDILEVYSPGDPVYDPETKELLGTLDYIKATIRVKTVFPKMCICSNADTTSLFYETGETLTALAKMQSLNSSPKRLNIDSKEISGGFEQVEKTIHVGDPVRYQL